MRRYFKNIENDNVIAITGNKLPDGNTEFETKWMRIPASKKLLEQSRMNVLVKTYYTGQDGKLYPEG